MTEFHDKAPDDAPADEGRIDLQPCKEYLRSHLPDNHVLRLVMDRLPDVIAAPDRHLLEALLALCLAYRHPAGSR